MTREQLVALVAKYRQLARVLRESKGGRNYRVRGAGVVAAAHIDDYSDELEAILSTDHVSAQHIENIKTFLKDAPRDFKTDQIEPDTDL